MFTCSTLIPFLQHSADYDEILMFIVLRTLMQISVFLILTGTGEIVKNRGKKVWIIVSEWVYLDFRIKELKNPYNYVTFGILAVSCQICKFNQ